MMDEGLTTVRTIAIARQLLALLVNGQEMDWGTDEYRYADAKINEYQFSWR